MIGGTRVHARRGRAAGRPTLAALSIAALALALGLGALDASASASATPADRAATHAYIAADLTYYAAAAPLIPGAVAAFGARATQLGSECAGVLAGAPSDELFGEAEGPSVGARRQGELVLAQEQVSDLKGELYYALDDPLEQAVAAPRAQFETTARALRWSDPAIAAGVRRYFDLGGAADLPPPNACADMRSWVASGYRRLPAASKEFLAARSAALRIPLEGRIVTPESPVLKRYEGAAERALLGQLHALRLTVRALEQPIAGAAQQLEATLGIKHNEAFRAPERPAKGSVVLAHGRTAAGEAWVARLEPRSKENSCPLNVSISSGTSALGQSSQGTCFSRNEHNAEPHVDCASGLLTITSFTRPATHSVRLLLSNGRTITTAAIRVPKRLGGPAGLYYQVVRGPSPIPVSLTELDAHGHTLRVVRLPAIVECTEHPVKYLPGGIRTLARGTVPQGPAFSIVAERYKFLGKIYLDFKAHIAGEGEGLLGQVGAGGRSFSGVLGGPPPRPSPFQPEESNGCHPHPYTLLFGVLHAPRDTVLARTPSGLVALHKVAIPARLHAGGVLAYGAFSPPPTALIVRAPDGRTISAESLAEDSKRMVEQCEGETEPAGP